MSEAPLVEVCIPNTKRDSFTYRCNDWKPVIGARVWVPFRTKTCLGVVIAAQTKSPVALTSLKQITGIIDDKPFLSPSLLDLCQWVSQYYQSPLSEVITLALPKHYRNGGAPVLPVVNTYALSLAADVAHARINQRAVRQHALIDFLAQYAHPVDQHELRDAGFATSQIKPLLISQIVQQNQQAVVRVPKQHAGSELPLTLNNEQANALEKITANLDANHRFLLHGITGSGKTEVYLQVIAKTLASQRQVLVIVPEIGLTPQLVARFTARFKEPLVVIHSNLSENERQLAWYQASSGTAQLVIGTRTAIFTPLPNLSLIVIDEEHDSSLKQQEGVRYSARDTALMRAHKANIPIILGSATPSLESLHNCAQQKYTLLPINRQAIATVPLQWIITDLRNTTLQQGLAPSAIQRIRHHLKQGNQVLVFINRRGFSPVLLCHQCGWIADCPACDSHLTLHRKDNRLICHHCGNKRIIPNHCQTCKSRELIPVGTGTQRLAEFLQTEFPHVTLMRVDRDEVRKKNELAQRLEQINQGEAQLIVGTQMMAKGHHFPKLTLVVIVDADCGFYNQDFRAIEHLGQLITQVAGRAGRANEPGEVIIQTHFPNHPLLNTLIQKGYNPFARELLQTRAIAQLPPYYFLAIIRAQSNQSQRVTHFLQTIKKYLQQEEEEEETVNTHSLVRAYGPAPAPMARKANQHRMQLLLKSPSRTQLQATLTELREWINRKKLDASIRWHMDVDPIDLS